MWPSHCLLARMSTPKIPTFITLLELLISIIGVDNHIKGVDIPSSNYLNIYEIIQRQDTIPNQ